MPNNDKQGGKAIKVLGQGQDVRKNKRKGKKWIYNFKYLRLILKNDIIIL